MTKTTGTIWPPLQNTYTDEFGQIEPEVYTAAGTLWNRAEHFAISTLGDSATGLRLMVKAAAIVSRKRAAQDDHINYLSAYLFQTYKHLVLAELEKENGHRQREREMGMASASSPDSLAEDVDRKILVQQIMGRMDEWMRGVFEMQILGYTFEEIGQLRNQNAHVLRTKFNKRLKRLMKEL